MKSFFIFLVILNATFNCKAQDDLPIRETQDKCIVFLVDDVVKADKLDDDNLLQGKEIGRFFASGGEGTLIEKRFRLGKSRLFVFASAFYEDDLFYDNIPHDAITFRLAVTRSAKENIKFTIALSLTQIEEKDDYGAVITSVLVNQKGKQSAVRMECQRKKS
jgi:hypothetical protein